MTASNRDEARRIGRALVEEGLAACVNVLGDIESIYRWEGRICEEPEVAFIAKTTAAKSDALTRRVVELHSYDTPCVSILPVESGHPAYLAWVHDSLSE